MLKLIFTIFLLFSFTSSRILADDFTGTGDNTGNRFYQTVAYTIGAYPSELTDHIVGYDQNDVVGMDINTFLTTHTLSSITDFGGNRTISGVADRVSLPPESKIDVVYLYKNEAGHGINLSHILIPLSSSTEEDAGLLDIVRLNSTPVDMEVNIIRGGLFMGRKGKYLVANNIASVQDRADDKMAITTLYVKNPLEIKMIHTVNVDKSVKVTLNVENISKKYLHNIYFEHHGHTEEFDLSGKGSRHIEYVLENVLDTEDLEIDLGSAIIRNPNSIKGCAVGEEENFRLLGLYTTSVFSYRLDGGYALGAMTAPDMGNFCVTVIPYTMSSENIVVSNAPQENGGDGDGVENGNNVVPPPYIDNPEYMFEDLLSNNGTNNHSVLGVGDMNGDTDGKKNNVFVLPKTFVRHWWVLSLLVVDVYLWYSYFRNKKVYENQNEDTKICTESSKDTHR
ncbi:MAG: hypothetical protein ACOX6Q_01710 [Candidatus Dojkabacteria bacterium]|jgi:hypothetical protein